MQATGILRAQVVAVITTILCGMRAQRSGLPQRSLTLLLAACEETRHFESAEELLKNPERLKELQTQCRYDREKVGNARCVAVSEALGKQVSGKGTPPYTPHKVEFYRSAQGGATIADGRGNRKQTCARGDYRPEADGGCNDGK